MRTKNILKHLVAGAFVLAAGQVAGQASVLGNSGGPTDYLGWDNTNGFPLMVRHNANQPIDWYTNAIQRMRLLPDATYAIGSGTPQVRDGSLLLCPDVDQFFANGAPGPYSLLQLAAATDNALQISNRDWMDIGITFTGNADHGYIGQKAGALDFTDMVIHWSDNPGEFLKDRLRFIFTSGSDPGALSGAQSEEGLEFMRFFPNRFEDPLVGIGDFYAANLADPTITEPTERLDIVNGRVRIRQLPTDDPEPIRKVMVVDDDGVVKWRPFDDFLTPAEGSLAEDPALQQGNSLECLIVTNISNVIATRNYPTFLGLSNSIIYIRSA